MKKNKNSKPKTGLLVFASLVVGCFLTAGSAEAAQGMDTSVTVKYPHVQGGVAHRVFSNISYYTTSNNLRVNFPAIADTTSYVYPFDLRASGTLTIPTSGTYKFRFVRGPNGGNNWARIIIYNPDWTEKCNTDGPYKTPPQGVSCNTGLSYTAGQQYHISFNYSNSASYTWQPDPQLKMEWDTPATVGDVWQSIPLSDLDSTTWDNTEISIPGTGMEQINYKIAGVGTDGLSNAELEFDLPPGITAGDILSGGTRLFWRNYTSSETLDVRNAATSDPVRTLTGTRLLTGESVTVALPDNFFANSSEESRVYLSFPNVSGIASSGGIALVVVFKDPSQPNGVLKIRTLGEGVHNSASHPVNFDITSRDPDVPLRAFFLFEDAESKKLLTTPVGDRIAGKTYLPRHNYMAMRYGSGTPPGEAELFFGYGSGVNSAADETSNPARRRIIPRADGVPDLTRTDNWYPMFGREGPQIDVLSTAGNYAPNKRNNSNNDYITADKSDGVFMDQLTIPGGNDWVSFQYAASDFYGDTLASLGSNESSYFTAAGLLYYDMRKLVICPSSGALNIGQKQQFNVYYWNDRPGGLPACSDMDTWDPAADAEVTNLSAWSVGNNSIKLTSLTGGPLGEVEGVAGGDTTVTATYNGLKATANLTVYDLCYYQVCNSVSGTCEISAGSPPPCPASSCTTNDQCGSSINNITSPGSWKEVAP